MKSPKFKKDSRSGKQIFFILFILKLKPPVTVLVSKIHENCRVGETLGKSPGVSDAQLSLL